MKQPWYKNSYRRMLVDMHIPDFDERFLANYDPAEMVRLYKMADLSSVMFYCQSHVGLCYWPTKSGKMHAGLNGRDIVGETVELLAEAGIASCAYYSVIFNNWAWQNRPQWRMVTENKSPQLCIEGRYGFVCPNNPGYQEFCRQQIAELLGGYKFDGLFYDMTFWPGVCTCEHCREKFRQAAGSELPEKVDWLDPLWCQFQECREQWMLEFAEMLNAAACSCQPGITVYHNFASALADWMSVGFRNFSANDFLGADFYGDPIEQLAVSKLMAGLTLDGPLEFMTSRCDSLLEHESTKSTELVTMQALATTLFSGAMLFIDAISPDGTANEATYKMIRSVYDKLSAYEPYLGGEYIEDVGVYFSSDSKMDFAENQTPLGEAIWEREYPHLISVRGACATLQENHIPFGVVTAERLENISRYKVLILPNVLRMTPREVDAIAKYVRDGGCVYASRYSSLTESGGTRHKDFMLADVFGCSFAADDLGDINYLRPTDDKLKQVIAPQRYLSHMSRENAAAFGGGMLRISSSLGENATLLATQSEAYGRAWGTIESDDWASIHSAPPWQDNNSPAIVANTFGRGRSLYSAADIERVDSPADRRAFAMLIKDLLADRQSSATDAHPCVWMSVAHQADKKRFIVSLLNYQRQLPVIPLSDVDVTLKSVDDCKFTKVTIVPEGREIDFATAADGTLTAKIDKLDQLAMLEICYS